MGAKESSAFFHEEKNMFDMQKVGERIAALRKKTGMTQADLAEWLGISYQAVSSWERGATMPDISKLVELSRALGTTVDALLTGEDKEMPVRTEEPAAESEANEQAGTIAEETAPEEEKTESFSDSLQNLMERMGVKINDQMQALRDKMQKMQLEFSGDISCTEENGKHVITIKQKKKEGRQIRTETIGAMAEHMDQELLEDVLTDAIEDGDEEMVSEIACYLEPETIERAMERAGEPLTAEIIRELAMYMSHGALEECALQALNEDDDEMMEEIVCHLDEQVLERALERFEGIVSGDMVETLACYASETALDLMIEKCDLDDEDTVEALSPYLNQRQMRALIKRLRER